MKYVIPRISDVFFLTIFISVLLMGSQMLGIDSDLGRHLVLGRYILDTGEVPTTDILSHTNFGNARPPYEWLSQILFSLFYKLMDLNGVIFLTALGVASSFALLYRDAVRKSQKPLLSILIVLIGVAASSIHWLPRPHIFSILFLIIWLDRLDRLINQENIPLWQFFVIMLIWANAHGGFIFGIMAWFAYLAGWAADVFIRKIRTADQVGRLLLFVGIISFAASITTPNGWGNWLAVMGNSSYYVLQHTLETMPPALGQKGMFPFWILFALSITAMALNFNKMTSSNILILSGFGLLGLLMARNIPLFAISAPPILAATAGTKAIQFKNWGDIEVKIIKIEASLMGMVWPVICISMALLFFYSSFTQNQSSIYQFNEAVFPVQAAKWIQDHPQSGNMFNEFNWGGYLLLQLWPEHKVFIDSQTDFYGEDFVKTYEQILMRRPGWDNRINELKIGWLILKPNTPLVDAIASQPGWSIQYYDRTTIILAKQQSSQP